jgi:hypothetical protein
MSCEEIRFWLQELHRRGWQWPALGRALGLAIPRNANRKAQGKEWIYRSEQIRMSYMLKRILAGELVPGGGRGVKHDPYRVAIAENPRPITRPPAWHIDLARGRVELRVPDWPVPFP